MEHNVPEPKKRSPEDVLAGIESSIMSFGDITPKDDKKGKDSDNKSQQKKDDKSAQKGKDAKKDSKAQAADPLFGNTAKSSKPADKKKATDKKLVSDDK